ncbi:MAG: hypothetical protein R3F60_27495 [bacterium]
MTDETPPRRGLLGALHRYRRVLGVAALAGFGLLMAGGIFLSQLDARLGLNLFGARTWVAGEPAVVRVALRDLRFDRLQDLRRARARLVDAEGAEAGPFELREAAGTMVQGTVQVPHAGAWTLTVEVEVEDADLSIEVPITALPTAPPVTLPAAMKQAPPPKADAGPVKLEVTPPNQVLSGNLAGSLMIRAMDEHGTPVEAPIRLTLKEGKSLRDLPAEVQTGRHGLHALAVQPMHPIFWLDLETTESFATRRLKHASTQFVLVTGKPVVQPGERLAVGVRSLHQAGPVFADVWLGERWIASTAATLEDGEARFYLPLPAELPEDPALLWVQAYRSPYLPGHARGGAYILATRKAPEQAVRAFARRLADEGFDPLYARHQAEHADAEPLLAQYLLGLPGRPDRDPPLLADTSESARQTIGALKGRWQRRFVFTLLGMGALLFGLLILLVRHNYRDVKRRWAEAGGDEDGALGPRRGVLLEASYIFFILALFLAGLVELVLTIRW